MLSQSMIQRLEALEKHPTPPFTQFLNKFAEHKSPKRSWGRTNEYYAFQDESVRKTYGAFPAGVELE